jgi:hypothetical protein
MSDSEHSTGEAVREAIERDGSIKIGLARGLINARALARYIQKTTHERYTFEALVSAIRRYPIKESEARRVDVGKSLRKLTLKNKIAVVTIKNSPELPARLAEFSREIDYGRGETFRVISGPESVFVVVDSKNLARIRSVASKSDLVMSLDNLAELVSTESEDVLMTPGILAGQATELAIDGVNLVACVAPTTSAIFILKEEDAMRAYRALERLSRG